MCYGNKNKSNCASSSGSCKKRVRFCEKSPQIQEIPHMSTFSMRHLQSCFYTVEEFAYISNENNTILRFMMIGGEGMKQVETETSTTRGLECKTLEGAEQKKIATLDGLCAVLLEQERQKQKNIVDEERIRQAYVAYTQVPSMTALKQGRLDARFHEALQQQQSKQQRGMKNGTRKSSSYFRNYASSVTDELQSTDTTLISSELSSDIFGMNGNGGKRKSMVRRLLKGTRFFGSKNNSSACSTNSSTPASTKKMEPVVSTRSHKSLPTPTTFSSYTFHT